MNLSTEDKLKLLNIARACIEGFVLRGIMLDSSGREGVSLALAQNHGAFVTLKLKGRLRGCIGLFEGEKPLRETVADMAISAAARDPRFTPVTEDELSSLTIEISVLSPMRRVDVADVDTNGPSVIEVGTHGLLVVKGSKRGVLLPQVATEHGFDLETFLDETCLKAGLSPGDWQDEAEVYIFEAEVFNEVTA